jgi:ribosomal protein S15P/S13E
MCHKRQRLLKYMERKERGSGRWQHMIETLGLSPATWKEQITL